MKFFVAYLTYWSAVGLAVLGLAFVLSGCVNPQTGQPLSSGWGSGQFASQLMSQIGSNCDIQGSIPGGVNFHCYASRGTVTGPAPAVTISPTQPSVVVSPAK